MKVLLVSILLMFVNPMLAQEEVQPKDRILCFDRFEDEIWWMEGANSDDTTCKAMLIAGTVGLCFEGDAQRVADQMNEGQYEYSQWQKVNRGTAELISDDIIQYGSYEGDLVGWNRTDNELFRCPEFEKIKEYTTEIADELESSVDYAVSRRYREEFGLPFWLQPKVKD